jgi:hypothetical protein
MDQKHVISFQVERTTTEQLAELARRGDRSLSAEIRRAIRGTRRQIGRVFSSAPGPRSTVGLAARAGGRSRRAPCLSGDSGAAARGPRTMSPIRTHLEPARVTTPERETPQLRSSASPAEVVFSRSCREAATGELFRLTRQDGLEAGGFLFGPPARGWHKRVEILHVTPTGNGHRTRDSLRLDSEEWLRAERSIAAEGLGWQLAGFYHSHPNTTDGSPSGADLRALLACLDWNEELGRCASWAVGLIACADRVSHDHYTWATPRLHAWVVRREGYAQRAICEKAALRCRA